MQPNFIKIPIDQAGRIVIPKLLRDHLGIQDGTEFEVIEEDQRIILRPIPKDPPVINKGGILVVMPDDSKKVVHEDSVGKSRDERSKKIGLID